MKPRAIVPNSCQRGVWPRNSCRKMKTIDGMRTRINIRRGKPFGQWDIQGSMDKTNDAMNKFKFTMHMGMQLLPTDLMFPNKHIINSAIVWSMKKKMNLNICLQCTTTNLIFNYQFLKDKFILGPCQISCLEYRHTVLPRLRQLNIITNIICQSTAQNVVR